MARHARALGAKGATRAPMADRLVEAAARIIVRDGFEALTAQSIEAEVGASRSLIHYHFGGKTGLLLAVVDTVVKDFDGGGGAPAAGSLMERLAAELESDRVLSADHAKMLLFIELLPHILRDDELRGRLRLFYGRGRYEDISVTESAGSAVAAGSHEREVHQQHHIDFGRALSAEYGEELAADLNALMPAMIDGLGIQLLVDPNAADHARRYRLWRDMVVTYLASRRASQAGE